MNLISTVSTAQDTTNLARDSRKKIKKKEVKKEMKKTGRISIVSRLMKLENLYTQGEYSTERITDYTFT